MSHQICGAARSKDPAKVSKSPDIYCLNKESLTFRRGNKRPAEINNAIGMSCPKKCINNQNAHDPQLVLVIDSDNDMETLPENDKPKRSLIDIQISKQPRSPDARLNGPNKLHLKIWIGSQRSWLLKTRSRLNGRRWQKVIG